MLHKNYKELIDAIISGLNLKLTTNLRFDSFKKQGLSVYIVASLFAITSCNSTNKNTEAEAIMDETAMPTDSGAVQNTLTLIPQVLEIGLPAGLSEKERKKGNQEDSIFYDLEMGLQPMDLEFKLLICKDDSLTIDQQEEQKLFLSYDGKTWEHPADKSYRSAWYYLPYFIERKFSLTGYKDENDYQTLTDDKDLELKTDSFEGFATSLLNAEVFATRYFIRLKTGSSGGNKNFILIINTQVGC